MSEIKVLTNKEHEEVRKYLYDHFWPCIEIIKVFEKCGLKQDFINKDGGYYYGYYYEGHLEGILVFTNNKKMLCHYTNDDILKKVDVLKAIKYHKPEYLTGITEQVKNLWKMFERTVKRYNYKESCYMMVDKVLVDNEASDHKIRPAVLEDAKIHINFFLNVEKNFNRKHMTINQIKDRINDRLNTKEYLLAEDEGRLIAQGFIEEKIHAFWQIGGVYTAAKYRHKGLGKSVVLSLIKTIEEEGCVPILAVLKDNEAAINLYKKIGFNTVIDYSILEIEF